MTWKHWLDNGSIQKVHVNPKSLVNLAGIVDRDLNDAQIPSLSADRRFAIAYNAALNLANYVIRQKGYRVAAKVGHHKIAFVIAGKILGITEVEDQLWLVSFLNYDLEFFDQERDRAEPAPNPFVPAKVLTM